jgi:hypothetical protein
MKFKDETLKLSRVVDWTLDMLKRGVLNASQADAVRNMAYEDCVEALEGVGSERDGALEKLEFSRRLVREWAVTGGRIVAFVESTQCSMASPGETERTVKVELERLRRELAEVQRRSDSKLASCGKRL